MVSWYEELKPKNGLQGIMAYNEEPETVAQYISRELTEQSIPFTVESINAKHKKSKSRNNFHVDKTITKTKNIGTFVAFVCIISIVLFVILQKSTLNNNRENDKNIEAYRNFLLEYNSSEKKHKDDKWGLFYLNDDDIPELFITNNSTAGNGPNVYTIKDHKVIQINDEMPGSYGSFLYSERNNCYVRLYSHSVFWVTEIFKLEDGSLFLEWKVTANRGYDETAISVEYGENELEKYKAYKESKGFSLYSGVTNEVYGIYCDYLSENNLRKKWRYDESKGELWSNFKCQYKNSIEETLSIDDFKKEYNKYLPDNLISVGPSNCLEFEENIINRCYEYAMSEDDINSAL